MINRIFRPIASLKLTVVLMVLAMALVYAGTTAQVDTGIWQVQKGYFHSVVTWINLGSLNPYRSAEQLNTGWRIPFPGGYAIGGLMLLNLIAAHVTRFRLKASHMGTWLIHFSLILLLLGELLTSLYAVESQMVLDEGAAKSYSEDTRSVELAVIDPSPADHDVVATIPGSRLARGGEIRGQGLPFEVRVDAFFPNAQILGPHQAGKQADAPTAGTGMGLTAAALPRASGMSSQGEMPAGYVTLKAGEKPLGTYLVSVAMGEMQEVNVEGKVYLLQLRFTRYYHPFTVRLLKFSHDRYPGTEVARNFSSRIRLTDPARNEDRETTIWMNHPLRHGGLTFYQASFLPGDRTSILQVVKNPAWVMPYVSCAIGGLGLVIHFGIVLVGFLRGRSRVEDLVSRNKGGTLALRETASDVECRGANGNGSEGARKARGGVAFPAVVTGLCLAYLIWLTIPGKSEGLDLGGLGEIPVSFDGRTQPLDSVARNALRVISGRQSFRVEGKELSAIQWLIDLWVKPEQAEQYKVIRIDQPDVIGQLNLDRSEKLFSIGQLRASESKLNEQVSKAEQVDAKARDLYQRKMVELGDKLRLYFRMSDWQELYLVPPTGAERQWQTTEQVVKASEQTKQVGPALEAFVPILQAYGRNQPEEFNRAVAAYQGLIGEQLPGPGKTAAFEAAFNRIDPFYACMILYVLTFVLAACSWLGWSRPLGRAAVCVMAVALVVHSFGLAGRIYISGRPPVTNLASSAVFIAWGAVLLAGVMELLFRNGVGSVAGAAVGFVSLLIYYNLAAEGDTMRVLVAVLDTNVWLATHVVAITLGYMATFVAGFLGILYVLRGILSRRLSQEESDNMGRMIYGSVCFGLLLSFVGTILGGIWADQSWGRFWGWDPKENGAVLIVLWNAVILHALWAKMVRTRGLAVLAVGGNVVTSWSWFGTNMMGVGLHSYGFMDAAMFWLLAFMGSQVLLMGVGGVVRERVFTAEDAEKRGEEMETRMNAGGRG